jgi:hypothetical protein
MNDELRRANRTATIVAIGMLASLGAYVVVVEVIRATKAPFQGFANAAHLEALRYVLFVAAMLSLGLARAARTSLISRRSGWPHEAPKRFLIATIVSLVYCELSAVLGLVVFLVQGRVRTFYVFLGLSLVGLILFFPRWSQWQEWTRRAG